MNMFNILKGFLGKAARIKNANDIPELTNFLKTSEVFKSAAWKIHDFKSKVIDKMDDVAFKNDPHNSPKYQDPKNNKKK